MSASASHGGHNYGIRGLAFYSDYSRTECGCSLLHLSAIDAATPVRAAFVASRVEYYRAGRRRLSPTHGREFSVPRQILSRIHGNMTDAYITQPGRTCVGCMGMSDGPNCCNRISLSSRPALSSCYFLSLRSVG